jgi:hypothetical protein
MVSTDRSGAVATEPIRRSIHVHSKQSMLSAVAEMRLPECTMLFESNRRSSHTTPDIGELSLCGWTEFVAKYSRNNHFAYSFGHKRCGWTADGHSKSRLSPMSIRKSQSAPNWSLYRHFFHAATPYKKEKKKKKRKSRGRSPR